MKDIPHFVGHRKRIREKFLASDISDWQDYEILEFMLSYSIARKDTKPLAKKLIERFGSLDEVISAPHDELLAEKGITPHSGALLKLFKEVAVIYSEKKMLHRESITSPIECVSYLKKSLRYRKDEQFVAIYLTSANKVISTEILSEGTIDKAVIFPRKLAERALLNKAASVIIAHNHPGGTQKISNEDVSVTLKLRDTLKAIDIALLDHLIIAGDIHISCKEKGII